MVMKKIIIITGEINSGKTTRAQELIDLYRNEGRSVGGIVSISEISDNRKTAYYAVDIKTGKKMLLASEKPISKTLKYGRFYFSEKGFAFGSARLSESYDNDVVFIDEVGPLEYSGKGFFNDVKYLIEEYNGTLVLVIRENIYLKLIKKFGINKKSILIERINIFNNTLN